MTPGGGPNSTDINTDPGCSRAMNPDMAHIGHSDKHGPSGVIVLGPPKWLEVVAQTPGIPMALVAIWVMDVNTDPGCSRTSDPALRSSPNLNVFLVLGDKQATNTSPFLIGLDALELPLTTAPELFCPFLSHFSTRYLLILMAPCGRPWMPSSSPDQNDPGCPAGVFHLPQPQKAPSGPHSPGV